MISPLPLHSTSHAPASIGIYRPTPTVHSRMRHLFVSGFAPRTTERELVELFQTVCRPSKVNMQPKWAKLKFDTEEDAAKALQGIGGQELQDDHELFVKPFIEDGWLVVSDLGKTVTKKDLKDSFEQFGEVDDATCVKVDGRKTPLGFGYVNYRSKAAAVKVVELMNSQMFCMRGSPRPIRVQFMKQRKQDRASWNGASKERAHFCKSQTLEFEFSNEWRKLQLQQEAELGYLKSIQVDDLQKLMKEQRSTYDVEFTKERDLKKMKMFLDNIQTDESRKTIMQIHSQPELSSLFIKNFGPENSSLVDKIVKTISDCVEEEMSMIVENGVRVETHDGKPWAKVVFAGERYADKARRALNARSGLDWHVKKYLDDGWLTVRHLSEDVNSEELRNAFGNEGGQIQRAIFSRDYGYGEVVKARVQLDARRNQIGYGYVQFRHRGAAVRVQEYMRERLFVFPGSLRPITVSFTKARILDPLPLPVIGGPANSTTNDFDFTTKDRSFCFDQVSIASHICQPATLEFDFATAWRKLQWQHTKETELMEKEHAENELELAKSQMKKLEQARQASSSSDERNVKRARHTKK